MTDIEARARKLLIKHYKLTCPPDMTFEDPPRSYWYEYNAAPLAALTEALTRIEELEGALTDIMNGRGICTTCGTLATGDGGGYTACDCARPNWGDRDPAEIARACPVSVYGV